MKILYLLAAAVLLLAPIDAKDNQEQQITKDNQEQQTSLRRNLKGGSSSSSPAPYKGDHVKCFEQVQPFLNSTKDKLQHFCEAKCVQDIKEYIDNSGLHMAHVHNMAWPKGGDFIASIWQNSPGGVGSTYVNQLILKSGKEKHFKYTIHLNSRSDADHLKHLTPHLLFKCIAEDGCKEDYSGGNIYEMSVRDEFSGIIYVLGSPSHAIFSLYSRAYQRPQYEKLHKGLTAEEAVIPKTWLNNYTAVFEASAKAGKDVFGIQRQFLQWEDLQDWTTFGYVNQKMRTPEMEELEKEHNGGSEYLKHVFHNFPPIFMVDIKTILAAPIVFASVLGVPYEKFQKAMSNTGHTQTSKEDKKLSKEEEQELLERVGAADLYHQIDQEMQQRIKQNFLWYGLKLFC